MPGACDGVVVLDLTWWMAGPLATMTLADCGARVIKVEPPGGDPARIMPAFQTWNRGKESLVVDLKVSSGRERFKQLVQAADVVVTGFRPGVAERLGVSYEQVRAVNPRTVYASISGFGRKGRYRNTPGYDALVAARSGRMTVYERIAPRDGPAFVASPYTSYATAMLLAQGILAGLHQRRRTGTGCDVHVPMSGAILPYDLQTWVMPQINPAEPDQSADRRHFATAIGRTYDSQRLQRPEFRVPRPSIWSGVTRDGVWLWIENTAQHLCVAQLAALDLLHLLEEERYAHLPAVFNEKDGEDLWQTLLERLRSKTYDEWADIFNSHHMAWERIASPVEALEHRQVIHNGHVVTVPGLDERPTSQPGPLVRFSRSETRIRGGLAHMRQSSKLTTKARVENVAVRPTTAVANRPLADITVIDLSTWLAGAFAPTLLADLGARVIAVEPLGGEPGRFLLGGLLAFATSQGKESIVVDLKTDKGRGIVHKLIAEADVVYHNYRAGVPERLGVDYETCRRVKPDIIYVNAAAYGNHGPDRDRPAFAGTMAAATGTALRQVGRGHPRPASERLSHDDLKQEAWRLAKTVDGSADVNAALAAATAVLLGLTVRDATGEGQAITTTMLCSNIHANSDEAIDQKDRPAMHRPDEGLFGIGPAYRLYAAAEGWVFLACVQRKEWDVFCRAIDRTDLILAWDTASASDGESAGELVARLEELFRSKSAAAWEDLVLNLGVPLVAVNLLDPGNASLADDDLREQSLMVSVRNEKYGEYWRHGPLQQFADSHAVLGSWEPAAGHTWSILAELGYTDHEINRLVDSHIIELGGT
jgi:crotonobetainyl-CoA:carnitine CoA-transferase CaiB-like acyl-CoA transferase